MKNKFQRMLTDAVSKFKGSTPKPPKVKSANQFVAAKTLAAKKPNKLK
jgi:hypothetical protein